VEQMTDAKIIKMKQDLVAKFHKRISSMQPGEEVKVAEFVFMSLHAGFSYSVVRDFLESYRDMGVVELVYQDAKVYIVKKPEGTPYEAN